MMGRIRDSVRRASVPISMGLALWLRAPTASADEPNKAPQPGRHEPLARVDVRAEEPRFESFDVVSSPRLPAPFSLPELSHPHFDVGLSWITGMAWPARPDRSPSAVGLAHATAETYVLFPRRLYVGGTLPVASARGFDGGGSARAVLGNLEGHVRAVFPMPSWLAAGALLALTVPTARFERHEGAAEGVRVASSLEPTDAVHFLPGRIAFRPALDVRILRGPFVVQARQGLDVLVDGSGAETAALSGRLLAHLGILLGDDVEISLESSQVYFFAAPRSRDTGPLGAAPMIFPLRRSGDTISPGIRATLGHFDVGFALVTDVLGALSASVDRFLAMRLSVVAHSP